MSNPLMPNYPGMSAEGAAPGGAVDHRQNVVDIISGQSDADFYDIFDLTNAVWTQQDTPRTTHPASDGDDIGSIVGINSTYLRASAGFPQLKISSGIHWFDFVSNYQFRIFVTSTEVGEAPTNYSDHCFFFPFNKSASDTKFVFMNTNGSFSDWGPVPEDGSTSTALFDDCGTSPKCFINGTEMDATNRNTAYDSFPTSGWCGIELQVDVSNWANDIAFNWHAAGFNTVLNGFGSIIHGPKSLFDTGTNRSQVEAYIADAYGITYS